MERVANKVALLKEGTIQMNYDIEELKSNIAHLKISSDKPLEQSEYYSELKNWHSYVNGATAKLVVPLEQSIDDFVANAPHDIEVTPISLEDWYLEVSNELY